MEILSRRQFQQREDFQQGLLTRMGSHSQQHTAEEYGEPAHMQYGAACMDTQYAGFKRPWPIATQQSETAEEFRFMLPEQSQVRARSHSPNKGRSNQTVYIWILIIEDWCQHDVWAITQMLIANLSLRAHGAAGWPLQQ